ncbi:MAG: hypothetical protein ABW175_11720 [Bradyrhizobium sp.]
MADPNMLEQEPDKPASIGLRGRIPARLVRFCGALAPIVTIGAVAGGLVGYWNVWKTVRTDILQDGQKTQREAAARPAVVPRLSLVVLPFATSTIIRSRIISPMESRLT